MKIKLMIAALLLALLAGCTKEPERGSGTGGDNSVLLNVPVTRSGDNPESHIANTRLIVFRSMGQSEPGKLLVNKYNDQPDFSFNELVQVGGIDIYVIANELPGWNLGSVTKVDDLNGKILSFDGAYPAVEAGKYIPMFSSRKNIRIDADGKIEGTSDNKVEFELERLYAKVVVNLHKSVSAVVTGLSIKNMPESSWLLPQRYSGTVFPGGSYTYDTYDGTEPDFDRTYTFYVPEYLISDKAKRCHVSIETDAKTYTLVVGDGIEHKDIEGKFDGYEYMKSDGASLEDLTVTRNTRYIFDITGIKNNGLLLHLSAEPWDIPVGVAGDPLNRMLNVSAVTATVTNSSTARIYFWSNQPKVAVEVGRTSTDGVNWSESGTYTTLSGVFTGLGSGEANIIYNDATKNSGYIDIVPLSSLAVGTYYRSIYINAGGLKREIRIKVLNIGKNFPAYPGVIGYDPVRGDLNLEGRGVMVYFKYGGIIAMYAGTSGSPDSSPYNSAWNGNASIAFNPSDFTDFSNYLSFPDNSGVSGKGTFTTVGNVNITGSFLNVANAKNGNGDPCRLVGMKAVDVKAALASGNLPDNTTWQLPTSAENSVVTMDQIVWVTQASPSDATQRNGHTFAKLDKGSNYTDAAWNFIPASGCRSNNFGTVINQGEIGYYWSSSPGGVTGGYYLLLKNNSVTSSYTWSDTQSYGFPIRCVRQP